MSCSMTVGWNSGFALTKRTVCALDVPPRINLQVAKRNPQRVCIVLDINKCLLVCRVGLSFVVVIRTIVGVVP